MSSLEGSTVIYKLKQVSSRLGVSGVMARRYLLAYEEVTGEALPREKATKARLVTEEIMGLLEGSRELIREDSTLSIEKALKSLLGLYTAPTPPQSVFQQEDTLAKLVEVITQQSQLLNQQNESIARLESELASIKQALPAPNEEKQRPWWQVWARRNTA